MRIHGSLLTAASEVLRERRISRNQLGVVTVNSLSYQFA